MEYFGFGGKRSHFLLAAATIILGLLPPATNSQVPLGSCFKIRYKHVNNCGHPLQTAVSRDRCCGGHYRRAWSPYTSPTHFQGQQTEGHLPHNRNNNSSSSSASQPEVWNGDRSVRRRLGPDPDDQLPVHDCQPCKTSCKDVRCGEDRQCVLRNGVPKCVCNPKCHLKHKAAVCGTDGRTYASECHLLKRSCRKKRRLGVAHNGPCQTCIGVKCKRNRSCVLDENLTPRCLRCPKSCSKSSRKRQICGNDGTTYASKCLMKIASCKSGVSVNKAYKGSCRENADCSNVKCWSGETCLQDYRTGKPECVPCGDFRDCASSATLICASDRSTYYSWCALKHTACRIRRGLSAMPMQYCTKNVTMSTQERKSKQCLSKHDKTKFYKLMSKNKKMKIRDLLKTLRANSTWNKLSTPFDVTKSNDNDSDSGAMTEYDSTNMKHLSNNESNIKKKRKRKQMEC